MYWIGEWHILLLLKILQEIFCEIYFAQFHSNFNLFSHIIAGMWWWYFFSSMIVYIISILFHFCLKFKWYGSFLNFHFTGEAMRLENKVSGYPRRLNSPSLVVLGLLVGCEIWLATCWHHLFVIRWCGKSLGDPSVATHSGSYDRWTFTPFLKATDNHVSQCSCAMLYKDTVQSIRYPEGSLVEGP